MKFEIEYAQFTKVAIEAESEEEANDIAATMDGEDIAEHDPHDYTIWNVTKLTQHFLNGGKGVPKNCEECKEFDKEELRCIALGYFVGSNSGEPCWDWYMERHEDCPFNPQN